MLRRLGSRPIESKRCVKSWVLRRDGPTIAKRVGVQALRRMARSRICQRTCYDVYNRGMCALKWSEVSLLFSRFRYLQGSICSVRKVALPQRRQQCRGTRKGTHRGDPTSSKAPSSIVARPSPEKSSPPPTACTHDPSRSRDAPADAEDGLSMEHAGLEA